MTADQVRQRAEIGDQLSAPREVEHSATFARAAHASHAVEELTELLGYQAQARRRLLKSVVEFKHLTPVDLDTADGFVREVVQTVESHGGRYDGWGGPVVD